MATRGTAALAMWWDMAAHMRADFEDWHTHEHFPERLGIPGFLRSSRWTDADNGEGVFVLYELENHSVLSSRPYLARLNAPTPWSTALMPHHRGMVRAQCHVMASCGGVVARYAATLRFSIEQDDAEAFIALLSPRLKRSSEDTGIVGAHLLRHETPKIDLTTEQRIRKAADKPADWVLIVCGYDRDILQREVDSVFADDSVERFKLTRDGQWHTYALSYSAVPSDRA